MQHLDALSDGVQTFHTAATGVVAVLVFAAILAAQQPRRQTMTSVLKLGRSSANLLTLPEHRLIRLAFSTCGFSLVL